MNTKEAVNTKNEEGSLDAVLFRFHREVAKPTPAIVAAWSRKYPEYASEIQAHAVEILDMESRADAKVPDMESLEAEARSAAMNAVYEAKQRSATTRAGSASLREAAEQAGIPLRELADRIGIARAIVVDVNSGAIVPETVNPRFLRAASQMIGKDFDTLCGLIAQVPQGGISQGVAFKAAAPPVTGKPRTWRDAVLASDMSDEKKAYWLSEEG
jgi:hypothetical protein